MTRIFDALRKSRESRGPLPATPEPAPPAMQAVGGRALAPSARISIERGEIVPLGPAAPLDPDATREMVSLRIHLEASLSARSPRTVVFVAAQPGEGTSTVALQFAEVVASTAQQVLLVDANQHRPSPLLAAARSTPGRERPSRGRVDLVPLADRLRRAGSLPPTAVRDALEALGPSYDWIVVDAPPLLESPEAAPLSSIGDGTVIVVQAGRTKRPVLARATDLLRRAGANVLGTVLNRRRLEIPDFIYRRI